MLQFLILLSLLHLALSSYQSVCDSAFCRILEKGLQEVSVLKKEVEEGVCVQGLGAKADSICNSALETFSQEAPLPDDSRESEKLYDRKVEDLERALDAPLHVVYLKQLGLIREKALKLFRSSAASEGVGSGGAGSGAGGSEYEVMTAADDLFRREAEDATRQSPDWSYTRELQGLKASLSELAGRSKKLQDARLQAAKQNQQAMQYLQMQQQQLQAIQQQIQGASSPWSAAMAYRVPDTNVNLAVNYQQGRATVQLSCVPDESAPLLGANGFVNGVTPGNLGLSFNINV